MTAGSAAIESLTETTAPARARGLQRLAAILGVLGPLETVAILTLSAASAGRFTFPLELFPIGSLATIVLYSATGALIAQQRPFGRVPWLMIGIGGGTGLSILSFAYGITGVAPQFDWPGAVWVLALSQLLFLPTISLFATSLLLVFPNDRLVGPRWRLVLLVAVAASLVFLVGTLFQPGAFDTDVPPPIANPLGAPLAWNGVLDTAIDVGNALALIGLILGAGSLVIRYRRADAVEAVQIRWLALVGVLAAVSLVAGALQAGPVSDFAFGLGFVFLASMPVAIGIAITRYRLYDIDRLINRALVYGSLTAILAGVFTAAVGLAQRMFVAATGDTSDAAIVATTLVVATLYAPLRKRLEAVVDRFFKYESRHFGAYRTELDALLGLIDADRAANRLARETLMEMGVVGVAVTDASGATVATAGSWPQAVFVRLPMGDGEDSPGALLVGPRRDGRPHDAADVAALAGLAILVGTAIDRR